MFTRYEPPFLNEFLDWYEYAHSWIHVICCAIAAIIAWRRTRGGAGRIIYYLLSGAFFCYALGTLFENLYITIYHVYPYGLSISNIPWIGVYVCFTAISFVIINGFSATERSALKRYRPAALAISALIVLPAHVYMVYLVGMPLDNTLYAIALFVACYYAALLTLAAVKGNIGSEMLYYHISVIVFVTQTVAMFLVSCFDESPVYYLYEVFTAMHTVMPFVFLYVAKKWLSSAKEAAA